jgi:hypothetical protein
MAHGIPTATPGIKKYSPLDRLKLAPQKKKLNNKQGTEKEYAAEEVGCSECTTEWEEGRADLCANFH